MSASAARAAATGAQADEGRDGIWDSCVCVVASNPVVRHRGGAACGSAMRVCASLDRVNGGLHPHLHAACARDAAHAETGWDPARGSRASLVFRAQTVRSQPCHVLQLLIVTVASLFWSACRWEQNASFTRRGAGPACCTSRIFERFGLSGVRRSAPLRTLRPATARTEYRISTTAGAAR